MLAKVTRDRMMVEIAEKHPEYGFAEHKGYGTKSHMDAIHKHGPCPYHRMTFAPMKHMPGGHVTMAREGWWWALSTRSSTSSQARSL